MCRSAFTKFEDIPKILVKRTNITNTKLIVMKPVTTEVKQSAVAPVDHERHPI